MLRQMYEVELEYKKQLQFFAICALVTEVTE